MYALIIIMYFITGVILVQYTQIDFERFKIKDHIEIIQTFTFHRNHLQDMLKTAGFRVFYCALGFN